MITLHRLISSCLGIGYIQKGSGTVAALFCCVCWYFIFRNTDNFFWQVLITVSITLVGIFSAGKVEEAWGKDSSKVVIDEIAGMCVSLLILPVQWKYIIAAFVLFRFFDIAKPLFIRKLEVFPGGYGVMADDLLAGIYSNVIMQIIIFNKLF
ncbi:MAG: phosphatidylglycerophosphatase A [Bacteroidetes bacterium]|nr:phosphatidylglycerophosphatase A [Bacteroidota bacterium]